MISKVASQRIASATLLGLALLFTPRAWAWGCRGHQIVALIAMAHLTPAVRAQVDAILAGDAQDPSTASCPSEGLPAMAMVANWADQVRNGTTAPYHYIDLPVGASASDADTARQYEAACADRCISWAITRYAVRLVSGRNPLERAKALRYVIHLVGDIHQPLHTIPGGGDRGLHAEWDSGELRALYPALSAAALAQRIDAGCAQGDGEDGNDPVAWAWESHRLAARLPVGEASLGAIESQLDLAGRRLARLLNDALATSGDAAASEPTPAPNGDAAAIAAYQQFRARLFVAASAAEAQRPDARQRRRPR
jgi:nuclease S1